MASAEGRKTSASKKTGGKSNTNRKSSRSTNTAGRGRSGGYQAAQDGAMFHEIGMIVLFIVMLFFFCCNFGLIGPVGESISRFMFGTFGFIAYVVPILAFLALAFWFANEGSPTAIRKLVAGVVLALMLGIICDLIAGHSASMTSYDAKQIYQSCSESKAGGGILAGSLAYVLHRYLGAFGTILVVVLCSAVSFILLTERSLLNGVRDGGSRIVERSRIDAERRREYMDIRRQEQEEIRARREEERRLRAQEREDERILRMEKRVTGVTIDTSIKQQPEAEKRRDGMHEISYEEKNALLQNGASGIEEVAPVKHTTTQAPEFDFDKIQIRSAHRFNVTEAVEENETADEYFAEEGYEVEEAVEAAPEPKKQIASGVSASHQTESIRVHKDGQSEFDPDAGRVKPVAKLPENSTSTMEGEVKKEAAKSQVPKKYMFPPLSRLQKGAAVSGDSTQELKETAMRLQQTLHTFGVNVTITDISQGPSVTRYELQPEQGVKVSKIVGLADDIKLNLAATDIRIEAPIPGKAAIGIEVPNKENMMVALRDLLESKEFKEFPSNIGFAVGKDIAGQTVVADIAKMPHMLIAGSTGSGKSVCINTLIMSILYKAHPDDVKLIMVDPKVVELSVYNGIPHLLIPVVTDPKKASAALHWAVTEMEDRYRKFADFNVRDLKGYNKKVESMLENGDEAAGAKLPQIVIIVDELADSMMVCPGEVEESICRLAQLARAAGIHLIIATQRPSVDVITGLIKANMPSRVAFAVSSGVDSRTILDMNGAEKLLGKGDMLFDPQGY
ncbi:MAG: DNA translocase FtsK, partial [Lachnospiraceae bacterium]|nr:DNA translocase FtsK [Lachnospiraceae bacterium]